MRHVSNLRHGSKSLNSVLVNFLLLLCSDIAIFAGGLLVLGQRKEHIKRKKKNNQKGKREGLNNRKVKDKKKGVIEKIGRKANEVKRKYI